jgi:hypothetical protein
MWVLPIPEGKSDKTPYTGTAKSHAIIQGGELMRNVTVEGNQMHITGDSIHGLMDIKILGGAPENLASLLINGKSEKFQQDKSLGVVTAKAGCIMISIRPEDLTNRIWKSIDSLPELHSTYSDTKWTVADMKQTLNTMHPLKTPVSLYGSDYGYHLGYLLFRGTFKASGEEKTFTVNTRGGYAYAHSIWIGDKFLGSWKGDAAVENYTFHPTHNLEVEAGKSYTFTILMDNMGHDQNWNPGEDESKAPIGILDYDLSGRQKDAISWKLAGNFGGEDYPDRARGPTNEGGLFAERQGYHLPNPPTDGWKNSIGGPMEGLKKAGVSFYTTTVNLSINDNFDFPTAIVIGTNPQTRSSYRLQIYVNGWQFGKYINDIGPQTKFPVPPGIWNTHGTNTIAMTFWNLEDQEVKVDSIRLSHGPKMCSGYGKVDLVESPSYSKRDAF